MDDHDTFPQVPLRPPDQVMRLARMGAMFPTRLSFLRSLLRRLSQENVQNTRPIWQMDANGFGHAVYVLTLGGYNYSLVAVSTDLPADQRTDRVIATAWDSAYVLYDGVPTADEVARIVAAAPRQEAARFTSRDLVLSRANKSVRLFAHVVQALRNGQQPNRDMIREVGYLMRTTAVYGNGKFGIADRAVLADRPGLEGPFAAEMLTVWLIRHFTHELVEHVGGARLDADLKRHLGIGNSTGLGMAPFLVNHPVLLNNWMVARETALARVRAIASLDTVQKTRLQDLADRAAQHLREWNVPDAEHQARIVTLRADWEQARHLMLQLDGWRPLNRLIRAAEGFSDDVQELMVALVLEPFGDHIDGLADCMADPFGATGPLLVDTSMVQRAIEKHCAWAISRNYDDPCECGQFWYVSEAKQEPRLGLRFSDPGADRESPLDIGRRIKALYLAIKGHNRPVTDVLAQQPEHALAIQRVQIALSYPYAEIQDNLIADSCLPIDMLRCKLSFFGASKFDPKSDRWTRITLCQGAPLADELGMGADDWWLPVFPS